MAQCVHCAKTIAKDEEVCPICGGEQPVEWMVKLVYVLAFLFVQGAAYRFIWPFAQSFMAYAIYFVITTIVAILLLMGFNRLKTKQPSSEKRHKDVELD